MKLNLSKIFNIKPNGGGYKTLKKLMGKYNIPVDEIKDIKKELNKESSNGDGGGVKEYYYKFKDDGTISLHMFYKLLILYTVSKIDIIVPFLNGDKEYAGEVSIITLFLFQNLRILPYFKVSDIIQPIVVSVSDRGNHDITTEAYTKGDLFTKVDYAFNLMGNDTELLEMLNIVKDNAIAITKEEYESMITYKPE